MVVAAGDSGAPRMVIFSSLRKPRVLAAAPFWLAVTFIAVAVAGWQRTDLAAQRPAASGHGPLWISESPLDEGRRLLLVVDEEGRHAAVYHVDAAAGTLTLKSCRDLSWDLTLDDFNAQEPKPETLRNMLQLPPAAGSR
jgi:hypothetical protein